ncbi:hypothetical protein CEDDRAFT_03643, partial [Frankia sp. CeD]
TGPLPRIMTTLRNLIIGLIRLAGHNRIAPTIRRIRHDNALLLARHCCIGGVRCPTAAVRS